MTNSKYKIFISGNLEGLVCTKHDVEELIDEIIKIEPDLNKNFIQKPVNLNFISKNEIQKLNLRFLNKDKPTNVLSFPSSGVSFDNQILGDIAICSEIIKNEACDQKKLEQNHLSHIILHSLLHLSGYDHQDKNSAEQMESLEVAVLEKLGIANPY